MLFIPDVEALSLFFVVSLILALSPGPDNIYVLSQSILRGARVGIVITLGLCSGLIVHTLAVALGVALIVKTSALAFGLLKLFGVGYLLYLAWQAFNDSNESIGANRQPGLGLVGYYRRGILMNLSNPKVAIFFLAFLPQFAEPARGSMTWQLILLGWIFIVAALLVFISIAILAARLGAWIERVNRERSNRVMTWLHRLASMVYLGLAFRLMLTQRL